MSAARSSDGVPQMITGGDDGFPAAILEKPQDRFNFRPHISGRKVAFALVTPQLVGAHIAESALGWSLVVEVDELRVGGNDKQIDSQLSSQKRRGTILVNDGFHPLKYTLAPDHRNAAASAGDHQYIAFDQ